MLRVSYDVRTPNGDREYISNVVTRVDVTNPQVIVFEFNDGSIVVTPVHLLMSEVLCEPEDDV